MTPRSSASSSRPHPHLYEINTWVWLHELSRKMNRTIRLGDVPDGEWDDLQAKGFDCIWLMGVWERSFLGRQIARHHPGLQREYAKALPEWQESDVVGSPYAVRAYRPDPDLGSWEQMDKVLRKLHDRGIKLILDFVPNHTALDHEWTTRHPEYYVQGTFKDETNFPSRFFPVETLEGVRYLAYGKDPHFSAWTDTAQLNYFNPATRSALLHELQTIAQYCDGVRCDMAMLVLNSVFARTWEGLLGDFGPVSSEFWAEAIALFPDFMWIAEVYWDQEWNLQQLGFHFTYDKRLYDRLRQASAKEVALHLQAEKTFQNRLVRFLENHDEARSAVVFGNVRLPAVSVLMSTLPGMRLYHQGQLEGMRVRIPVQLGRGPCEHPDQEVQKWYERLLQITDQEVFHFGQWRLLQLRSTGDSSFETLIAYDWRQDVNQALVVVNLGFIMAKGEVLFLDEEQKQGEALPSDSYNFYEPLINTPSEWNRCQRTTRGLMIEVPPYEGRIFMRVG